MKSHFLDKSLAGVCDVVGGVEAFRCISKWFHHKIEQDPSLAPFFPSNMVALEERLALYLTERTGGPADYTTVRGKTSLLCRHAHLAIGTAEAERWLQDMAAALAEEGVGAEDATQLLSNLTRLAATLTDPFVLLYRLPLSDLRAQLEKEPSLALASHHGRNLLCATAIACDVPRLCLLLEFGADVAATDSGGHNALYRVANSGDEDAGRAALELLVEHGADVKQVTGIGGMTPLHMSARRGTTPIAEALLDAGADIEAQDKNGETPLRRAVNCRQERMACFLLARGADPRSADKNGQTPLDAARSENMHKLLVAPIQHDSEHST